MDEASGTEGRDMSCGLDHLGSWFTKKKPPEGGLGLGTAGYTLIFNNHSRAAVDVVLSQALFVQVHSCHEFCNQILRAILRNIEVQRLALACVFLS